MALPLLERVAFEEQLVEFAADLGNDDFLGVRRVSDRDPRFFQPCGELFRASMACRVNSSKVFRLIGKLQYRPRVWLLIV